MGACPMAQPETWSLLAFSALSFPVPTVPALACFSSRALHGLAACHRPCPSNVVFDWKCLAAPVALADKTMMQSVTGEAKEADEHLHPVGEVYQRKDDKW